MLRIALAFMLALLCCGQIEARPRHWYTSGKFWIGEAVIVGAEFADARTTCKGFSRGLVEGNPLDRGAQNCGSAVGMISIGTAIDTGLHIASFRMSMNEPSVRWRFLEVVTVPAIACAFACTAAISNAKITPAR